MELLQRAHELYSKGQMYDALEAAQAACERRPKSAEAWRLLGAIARYLDMPGASDDAFRRAAELSRRHRVPVRLTAERFQELVDRAQAALSADARRRLRDTRIRVEPLPGLEEVRQGMAPDTLHSRSRGGQDLLTIFQVNHENRADSETALEALLIRTLSRA
jgi:hypothetical protein